jgi:hypothetical protein
VQIGACVSGDIPFIGLPVLKTPAYYIDYENPISIYNARAQVFGKSSSMKIWHTSNPIMPPPRLDSNDWEKFKKLTPPGLLIVDTLRGSNLLEESNSSHMSLIFRRLKELRDVSGSTVVVLHHSPKGDDRASKGSSAITDQADHVLSLERLNNGGNGQNLDVEDWTLPLRLGVRTKTRYQPFSLYLRFNPACGFEKGEDYHTDDDAEPLRIINKLILDFKRRRKTLPNQSQIADMVKGDGINKKRLLRLLKKGVGDYWNLMADPHLKAKLYDPVIQTDG